MIAATGIPQIYFTGAESELDPIARAVFGVPLAEIKSALPR
jgi:hypothetical protein